MSSGIWSSTSGGGSNVAGWLLVSAVVAVGVFTYVYVVAPFVALVGAVGACLILGTPLALVVVLVLRKIVGTLGLVVVAAVTAGVLIGVFLGSAALITTIVAAVVIETGAGVSAVLDHLEADIDLPSWRHQWAYGHLTMARRVPRRIRWWWGLGRAYVRHASREIAQPLAAPQAPTVASPAVAPTRELPESAPTAGVVDLGKRRRDGAA